MPGDRGVVFGTLRFFAPLSRGLWGIGNVGTDQVGCSMYGCEWRRQQWTGIPRVQVQVKGNQINVKEGCASNSGEEEGSGGKGGRKLEALGTGCLTVLRGFQGLGCSGSNCRSLI